MIGLNMLSFMRCWLLINGASAKLIACYDTLIKSVMFHGISEKTFAKQNGVRKT